jgi:class 3 adenylate cyclase/tetratricopeptide (TPR) repeat protein
MMTFEEILDQAIAMLQRRRRLTYGTLKRQFQLDDAALEDLKNELIEGQRLAVDERGNVLVWTGEAGVTPAVAPHPEQTPQPPAPQEASLTPITLPLPAAPAPEAERRQLTVMFCDLVDSTKLASQLDPEDYRDVARAYQQSCAEVITRFDGHIAQLLGDGLLIYFGYPQAHEDDAQRAVRTGLGILSVMGDLNKALQQTKGIQLGVRLGIHTGLVVIGDMGSSGRQEQLALGETPNIASRLEGLAASDTVAISEATYRLVQGYFACQDLGAHALRGVPETMRLYHVLGESGATSRLDVAQPRGLTPLVGREQEVGLLLERWAQVKDGQGHVVLLTGDAGIGKSRLVQILKDHIANEPHTCWECRSAEYSQNTALFPLTDLFQRIWQFEAYEAPDAKLAKLEHALSQYRLPLEESVQLFAPLLSLPIPEHRYPPLNLSPQRQRQKTLETIVAILQELAERQPVLFIVEDLHWTDPTTLELLNLVIDQTPTAALFALFTCRPHFQPSWTHRSYLTEVSITRLSQPQVERIVERVAGGKTFPDQVMQQIVEKTDGVPLFVEEITKSLLESGQLRAIDGHYELTGSLSTFAIPATLQDSLMARLDRLMTAKVIAQLGATLGRQFSYALLQAVAQLNERTLHEELHRLIEAEIVYQRGLPPHSTYVFKHALIQNAAYESLLRSTRQQYHQRIAQVLEIRFPELVEGQPELLAHHALGGGMWEKAVSYFQQAGAQATARLAYREAVAAFEQALGALQHLPESRTVCERAIDLRLALDFALWRLGDWGRVLASLREAEALAESLGDQRRLAHVSSEMADGLRILGDYEQALKAGQRALTLASALGDTALQVEANTQVGLISYHRGDYGRAIEALRQTVTALTRHSHRKRDNRPDAPAVWPWSWLLVCLSQVGAFAEVRAMSAEVLRLAETAEHPFRLVVATFGVGRLSLSQGDLSQAIAVFERGLAGCQTHDFRDWLPTLTAGVGHAYTLAGRLPEALTLLEQAVGQYAVLRGGTPHPLFVVWLGEAYLRVSQLDEAGVQAQSALVSSRADQARGYEAYALQLLGEVAAQRHPPEGERAEAHYRQALALANELGMRPLLAHCHRGLGALYLKIGQQEQARAELSAAIALYRAMDMTFWLPQTEAMLAQVEGR